MAAVIPASAVDSGCFPVFHRIQPCMNSCCKIKTILASLDIGIEGDRLGLGTNLFSDEPTLPEMLGRENFEKELKLYSKYYFANFVIE